MKLADRYLNYGLQSFIAKKQLSRSQVATWCSNYNPVLDKHGFITNATEILESNWKAFADWVNIGLKDGTLKGINISLSNGSAEEAQKRRQIFAGINKEVKELYSICYKKDKSFNAGNLFNNFHKYNGSTRRYRCGDGTIKIEKYLKDFEQIIEDNLQKEFIEFINLTKT